MNEITNNDAIQGIIDSGLSRDEQLGLWVSLCDCDKIMNHLKQNGLMASIGMTTVTPLDEFTYGILRIARPDLFIEKEKEK